ncbi:MAG: leucine-rich repeat domain-containing protein [Parachlamydiales bacterium]
MNPPNSLIPPLRSLAIQSYVEQYPTASPNFNASGNLLEANAAVLTLEQWVRLKSDAPIGPINFPKVMRQIEKKYSEGIGFQTELQTQSAFSFRAVQLGLPSNCKVNLLFYDLARKLLPEYQKAGLVSEERMSLERISVDPVEFVPLQTKLNEIEENQALEQIWTQRLSGVFQLDQASEPRGHEAIRAWLNDPANLQAIANVRTLNLSNLLLKVLPKEISLLKGLQRLNLSNNQLRYLPEALGDLNALKHLGLKNNRLTHLPESFGNLAALTQLSLENNRISHLPKSFENLSSLITLSLANNYLSQLPESFGNLRALTNLWLNNNYLSELPEFFGDLAALKMLCLHNNHLSQLPESFGNLTALKEIVLYGNHLSQLPKSFGYLSALTSLDLCDNCISQLPDSFGNLRALRILRLEHNHLTYLPESFSDLKALEELELDHNRLSHLPESFGNLRALTNLGLAHNRLTYLPESFGNLRALTNLGLAHNRLTYLPESFGDLRDLTELELDHNRLSHLPESFGNFEDFEFLFLYDNPLLFISDIELKKEPTQGKLMEHQAAFLSYSYESDLGCLFRNLMDRNASGAAAQFDLLPNRMKSRIELRVRQDLIGQRTTNSQGKEGIDPSANIHALARAVRMELYEGFASLDEEQKNAVYSQIGELAGHEGDLTWSEEHAFDHVLRFADAYASVVSEETGPMRKKQKIV